MKTLQGSALAFALRELSDGAKQRVWIVSPYIGQWQAAGALLGANWWRGTSVILEVITDLTNPQNVNKGTLRRLLDRGAVRQLLGVNAKIFVVGNDAILTSANFTNTGFRKRYEAGILLRGEESKT
jgi:phosphatidylserine/phosphatidylglycerophosphate/cardiolipin synthase-like enzyme